MSESKDKSHAAAIGCTALLLLLASACSSMAPSLSRLAAAAAVPEQIVSGAGFQHRLFMNHAASATASGPLLVFLEGDGKPWSDDGRVPATDPTARRPLAFQLFLATQQPALFITRPCYDGLRGEGCSAQAWTSARYSTAVLDSLAAALLSSQGQHAKHDFVLVGYSGGGVLATLLAARLPRVAGVITIAANLDVAAWTTLHGYLPLAGSLDPAREAVATTLPQVVLVGERDRNVPPSSIAGYLARHPEATVISYPRFDHACCWLRDWQAILPQALQRLR